MKKYQLNILRIFSDFLVLAGAFFMAYWLRLEFVIDMRWLKRIMFAMPYVVVFEYFLMVHLDATQGAWRYVSLRDATRIGIALSLSAVVFVIVRFVSEVFIPDFGYLRYSLIPLSVIIINLCFASIGTIGIRILRRMLREKKTRINQEEEGLVKEKLRTVLIGAGEAGIHVLRLIKQRPQMHVEVIGFIDDNQNKIGRKLEGIPVLGDSKALETIKHKYDAQQAIITIAHSSAAEIRRIVNQCQEANLPVKIIPKLGDFLEGKLQLSAIREVQVEDLLYRDSVQLEKEDVSKFIHDHVVLVSGAGGSIGSELCRQVLAFEPRKLILLDQSEFALYTLDKELRQKGWEHICIPVLADIGDSSLLEAIFAQYGPAIVFHAAAYKHVPMLEQNPVVAIRNNVGGTKNMADIALQFNCEAFVMVSTDKAVNPTSIMGATKRVAEMYIQMLSMKEKTKFLAVRFGNVLGSTGSVLPLFREQIKAGGPLTVTHPEMQRYFMTIPEAAQLVMQAATMGKGGEIFVLDMGEPVKILDLAKDLIRLSGKTEEEIGIQFTGTRPGEKLFEELGFDEERMEKTQHPKIFVGKLQTIDPIQLYEGLEALERFEPNADAGAVRKALHVVVPEMQAPHT